MFTTKQAAGKLGVSRQSLHAWMRTRRIEAPPLVRYGQNGRARLWTAAKISSVRAWHRAYVPRLGRPSKDVDVAGIARLRAQGAPWRVVAQAVGCCIPTARRALRASVAIGD